MKVNEGECNQMKVKKIKKNSAPIAKPRRFFVLFAGGKDV
jgi:hypothetical protein